MTTKNESNSRRASTWRFWSPSEELENININYYSNDLEWNDDDCIEITLSEDRSRPSLMNCGVNLPTQMRDEINYAGHNLDVLVTAIERTRSSDPEWFNTCSLIITTDDCIKLNQRSNEFIHFLLSLFIPGMLPANEEFFSEFTGSIRVMKFSLKFTQFLNICPPKIDPPMVVEINLPFCSQLSKEDVMKLLAWPSLKSFRVPYCTSFEIDDDIATLVYQVSWSRHDERFNGGDRDFQWLDIDFYNVRCVTFKLTKERVKKIPVYYCNCTDESYYLRCEE